MKLIKRISDNVVLYAENMTYLDATGVHGPGWNNETIDPTTLTTDTCTALPDGFIIPGWAYASGVWTIVDMVLVDKALAQQGTVAWKIYQQSAQAALDKSGITMERIAEGLSLGTLVLTNADVQTYMNWRRDLRAILSEAQPATIPTSLPAQPAFPKGT